MSSATAMILRKVNHVLFKLLLPSDLNRQWLAVNRYSIGRRERSHAQSYAEHGSLKALCASGENIVADDSVFDGSTHSIDISVHALASVEPCEGAVWRELLGSYGDGEEVHGESNGMDFTVLHAVVVQDELIASAEGKVRWKQSVVQGHPLVGVRCDAPHLSM